MLNLNFTIMKTKTFLLVCLFLGLGFTQLSAQDGPKGKNGNGSDSYWMEWGFYASVACDGQWVDYVEGTLHWHVVDHYKNGVWVKEIMQGKGVLTSTLTGETFTISELDKLMNYETFTWTVHTYLKGDQGNHYMISFIYDSTVGDWVVTKFGCPGNEMNNGN